MRRDIKKSFWVTREENEEIRRKAQAACLSEAELIRQLVSGYTPAAKPDERFWEVMDLMRGMADNIDMIAMNTDKASEMIMLANEAKKWRMLQNAIEKEFLRPKRSDV